MSPSHQRLVICLSVLWSVFGCRVAAEEAEEAAAPIETKVEQALHKAANFIQQQQTFKLTIKLDVGIQMATMKQEMSSKYSVVVARPDRIAMRAGEGDNGPTFVSDGKQLATVIGPLKKYVVGDSPAAVADVFAEPAAGMIGFGLGGPFLHALFSEDVYAELTEGVTVGRDVGAEKVDGHSCRRLHFEQADYDWDLWVDDGEDPLPRKAEFDPTKRFADQGNELLKNAKMSASFVFASWDLKPELTDEDFAFTPPAGFEKVDNLFGGRTGEEEPSPLLGKDAPAFTLENLEGEKVELAQHRGKDVVILDFWATWCGPCRKALPIIAKVAKKYHDKGVAFYAVDTQEEPDDVRKFLAEEKLELPVIFDTDGEVAKSYLVDGIPKTVLVGKDGTVQVVHVGLSSNLEARLSKELEDLLAGKDLAAESRKSASTNDEQNAPAGLELVWSHDGSATGIAAAADEAAIYCVESRGRVVKLDAKGAELDSGKLQDKSTYVRLANLAGDKQCELLTFAPWGPTVKAHAPSGELLWSYAKGQGIDDVATADLNGDGLDEVVIGYNGGTGLHVLDNTGKLMWSDTSIGNVWHVAVGNVDGDATPEVVTTSARGKIHIFNAEGKHLRDLEPELYCHMIRTWHDPADKQALDLIVVAGTETAERKDQVLGLSAQGELRWTLDIPARVEVATACRDKPWLAIGLADSSVRVIDVLTGQEIGQVRGVQSRSDVAWLSPPEGPPLLVVSARSAVRAYGLEEQPDR